MAVRLCLKHLQKIQGLRSPICIASFSSSSAKSLNSFPHRAIKQQRAIGVSNQASVFSSRASIAMAKSSTEQDSRPNITIRPANLEDAKSIADLGAQVFSDTFGHSVQPHELQAFLDESYTVEAVTKELKDPQKDTILAFDQIGDLLGFAMLTRGSTEPCVADLDGIVELQRIYLYPKAHGTGTGKALAIRLEDMAREQGFKHIWLGVWQENVRAQKAYEKWGYKVVGTHDFVVGSVVQTDDILVKKL
ncbi:GNAT family acetyltransferase [Colletotrichum truncatum]|uniref:GNAT family acetyltransferase n=1 Tax=Colletotrichum truncatum TaxID=5467 RepID=A0ACC3ZL40_COLTU|nr:GNAT family acetyltransferase [Colletotrichum truncatum]KAF6786934.1 GNAT family acetyltransferase [Colletotrichum truncatum]